MNERVAPLYPPIVLEHCKRPRNFREPADASHRACGDNPLCGDHVEVYVRLEHGAILDIAFAGESCAVAKASASMMTEAMMGRDAAGGRALVDMFLAMVNMPAIAPDPRLGELAALAEVRAIPARIPCALLAWDALKSVLAA
jgi:nitrogen fixation NifU-like protein